MPAWRLFIGLADTGKVTTNYSWSACLYLERIEQLHRLCQRRITPLTFLCLSVWVCLFCLSCLCAFVHACVSTHTDVKYYIFVCVFKCVSVSLCLVSLQLFLWVIGILCSPFTHPDIEIIAAAAVCYLLQSCVCSCSPVPGVKHCYFVFFRDSSVNVSQYEGFRLTPTSLVGETFFWRTRWAFTRLSKMGDKSKKES